MALTVNLEGIPSTLVVGNPVPSLRTLTGLQATLQADLDAAFFNDQEFAGTFNYYHSSGESEQYEGIFDEMYESISFGAMEPMSSVAPHVLLPQHKMVRFPVRGDKMLIRGVRYEVEDFKPDGVGMIDIVLTKEDR